MFVNVGAAEIEENIASSKATVEGIDNTPSQLEKEGKFINKRINFYSQYILKTKHYHIIQTS